MSSTVIRRSSSGKIATRAEYAIRAARLPAWSSPNFFHTATGKASQACRCWYSSTARRSHFSLFIARKRTPGSAHPSAGKPIALSQAITVLRVMCYRQVLQVERDELGPQAPLGGFPGPGRGRRAGVGARRGRGGGGRSGSVRRGRRGRAGGGAGGRRS